MSNESLAHIGFKEITDLIFGANNSIIISLPNIHDELCESILSYKKLSNNKTAINIANDVIRKNMKYF